MPEVDDRIDVQFAFSGENMPSADDIRQWAEHALQESHRSVELTIRIVDEAEITSLNRQYRGKDGATNVLSFPYEPMPGVTSDLLGDVVICAPVVAAEAIVQNKLLRAHWAHLVIHGVLHLLGYGHLDEGAAREMEALEQALMAQLGFADPYRD